MKYKFGLLSLLLLLGACAPQYRLVQVGLSRYSTAQQVSARCERESEVRVPYTGGSQSIIAVARAQLQAEQLCEEDNGWARVPIQEAARQAPLAQTPSATPTSAAVPVPISSAVAPPAVPTTSRRTLRVRVNPLSGSDSTAAGLETRSGLRIDEVFPDGVGQSSGMMAGDILLALDNVPSVAASSVQQQLNLVPAGAVVTATIWRNRQAQVVPLNF